MTKPNLQEIPDQKHPGTPKTRSKKPLIMVASLISSMVAAVVVGLLIVNSSAFKSFRSELATTTPTTKTSRPSGCRKLQ